jgi:lysophospholipase L1-like esterase
MRRHSDPVRGNCDLRPKEVTRVRPKIAILLAALASAVVSAGITPGAAASTAPVYYVALGDSLATGAQPARSGVFAGLRAANGTNRGYADVLHDLMRDELGSLQLRNFGCGGETTESLIAGGNPTCGYVRSSQLAEAIAFLEEHDSEIAFVTIDIGGNDLLAGGGVPAIAQNLPVILDALQDALGPDVPIVGMNYYDPFVVPVWFQTQSLAALQAEAASIAAFNDFLEGIYQAHGIPIADVQSAFAVTDHTIQPSGLPLSVQNACQWTWMCAVGDIHPNDPGYRVIAQAFAAEL